MTKTICVYCSSSDALAPAFFDAAQALGGLLARQGRTLIYGGAMVGLMGALARAVHEQGGRVVGVIPEHMLAQAYHEADELVVTRDMRERKAVMAERAEAFVGMPGGFGTLEEVLEVLTLKQLQLHNKPIVLLNTLGFYDHLVSLFEYMYSARFAKPAYRQLYHVVGDACGVMSYIDAYVPVDLGPKWFGPGG
jgi:hypothetical protein